MLYILQQRCIFAVQTNEQTNKRTNIVIIIKVQKVTAMRKNAIKKINKFYDKIELIAESIREIVECEQQYYDDRSYEWQESDQGEDFLERISSMEVLMDDLEKVAYDLNEFIEEYNQ